MPDPVISNIDFDAHGGPDGQTQAELDFSVNSNPFGPARGLLEQLHHTPIHTYPDPTCSSAKQLAAAHHGVDIKEVCFGAGAADLIDRLSRCYLDKTRSVLIAAPSFGEYARAAQLCGAEVHVCNPYKTAEPDVGLMLRAIHHYRPTLVWLCHPNNPTGHAWKVQDLQTLAKTCRGCDSLLVLDLAYIDFLQNGELDLPAAHVVQLYSLTKSFRMPGIRLGYALATPEIVHTLESVAPPWHVSAHALAAAEWVFSKEGRDFLRRTLPELANLRQGFQQALRKLGLDVHDTHTNYFLVEVGNASRVKKRALQDGFRVRDCSSFALPSKIRLAAQLAEENQRLVDWFAQRCGS